MFRDETDETAAKCIEIYILTRKNTIITLEAAIRTDAMPITRPNTRSLDVRPAD